MREWFIDSMFRTLKTFAQALIGVLGTGGMGIFEVDWKQAVSVALMSAIICLLGCISALPVGKEKLDGR